MIRTALLVLVVAGSASTALAQSDAHAGHVMPAAPAAPAARATADPHADHAMPAASAAPDPHAGHQMTTSPAGELPAQHAAPTATPNNPHAGHQMPAMPAEPAATEAHAVHAMAGAPGGQTGADLPVGNAPPPPVIRDNMADQVFDIRAMERARSILAGEHGAVRLSKLMINLAEYQAQPPGGGYRWDVEGWYGGDLNRFVVKSEGEGSGRDGVELAELQGLYSRAVARYTDLQVGVRHDFEPKAERTYATVGFESQFPYWFDVEAAAFLSDRGDLIARLEGTYDLRLTQRVVLQPQAEVKLSAQRVPDLNLGSGLTHAELGLRLRYEIRREFAPYIGVAYERAFGTTADYLRAAGEDVRSTTFVIGLRAWF